MGDAMAQIKKRIKTIYNADDYAGGTTGKSIYDGRKTNNIYNLMIKQIYAERNIQNYRLDKVDDSGESSENNESSNSIPPSIPRTNLLSVPSVDSVDSDELNELVADQELVNTSGSASSNDGSIESQSRTRSSIESGSSDSSIESDGSKVDDTGGEAACSQPGAKEGDFCGPGGSGTECISPDNSRPNENMFCGKVVADTDEDEDEIANVAAQKGETDEQKLQQQQIGTEAANAAAEVARKKQQEKNERESIAEKTEEDRLAQEAAKTPEQQLSEEINSEIEKESDGDEDTTPTTATSVIPPPPSAGTPPPIPPVPSPPSSMSSMSSSVDEGMTDVMRQGIKEQEQANKEREREQEEAKEAAKKAEEEQERIKKEVEAWTVRSAGERSAGEWLPQLEAERQAELHAQDEERRLEAAYLNGIKIRHGGTVKELNSVEAISHKLLNPELINFGVANKFLQAIEWTTAGKNFSKDAHWIDCKGKCYDTLTKYLNMEFKLTAFMLRILSKSVIDITNENPLVFHITDAARLTGQWEQDKEIIDIVEVEPGKKKRLIMGFGPSASGKTFWTENVIRMMDKADPNFPKVFMSVDGGIIREFSEIYQEVVKNTPKIILGFKNLTQGDKMAPTNGAKKAMKKYLFKQKEKNNKKSIISIYVPETLSKCKIPVIRCNSYYKDFMELTGDKNGWIGMYIWQERDKCVVSGKARELKEGKKYTDKYYPTSKKYGLQEMKKGMGGRIDIHNSGSADEKSTITEHPTGERKYLLNSTIVREFNSNYQRADKKGKVMKERRKNVDTRMVDGVFGQDELILNPTGRNVTNIPPPSTPRGLQMGDAVRKKKATRKLKKIQVAPPRGDSKKNKTSKKPQSGNKGGKRSRRNRNRRRPQSNFTRRNRIRRLG